ncbi:MAG: radical SAM protein [Anaerolineae bacterium]|nr:radical SAM protein [Anaerolineae bacterium]
MADVLYVHPAKHGTAKSFRGLGTTYPFMPVGVVGLVNLLRSEGISVRGINYPAELAREPDFDLAASIGTGGGARVVLIDLHWYEHCFGAIDVARLCKRLMPDVAVILGGITATIYAREILASHSSVDCVVLGDAEATLVPLVQTLIAGRDPAEQNLPNLALRRGGEVVVHAPTFCAQPELLDRLDFVDLSFLDHPDWYRRMQFSATGLTADDERNTGHWLCIGRGCSLKCSFCGGGREAQRAIFGREAAVMRSPERVANDIGRLADLGVRQVSLSLDPCLAGPQYWRPLLKRLREAGIMIGLYNEHFALPGREFVRDLAETADVTYSELGFTLLSGSEAVRRRNGRHFSNRDFLRLLELLRSIGMPIYVYFSLNLPGENEKTLEETLSLADRIAGMYPPTLLKMISMFHTLDPLSPMAEESGAYGVDITYRSFQDYYNYCRATPAAGRVPSSALRGFRDRSTRDLDAMAERWNQWSRRRGGFCYPVPPTW